MSEERSVIPAATRKRPYILRSCDVDAPIPLLGSRVATAAMGMVLDQICMVVHFVHLGSFNEPIVMTASGHIATSIADWPEGGFPALADNWPEEDSEVTLPHACSDHSIDISDRCSRCDSDKVGAYTCFARVALAQFAQDVWKTRATASA